MEVAEATGNYRSKSWSLDLSLVREKCKVPEVSSSL